MRREKSFGSTSSIATRVKTRTDVDRDAFGWELRRSLTSMLTVCPLTRNQGPLRIEKLARHLPGDVAGDQDGHEVGVGRLPVSVGGV